MLHNGFAISNPGRRAFTDTIEPAGVRIRYVHVISSYGFETRCTFLLSAPDFRRVSRSRLAYPAFHDRRLAVTCSTGACPLCLEGMDSEVSIHRPASSTDFQAQGTSPRATAAVPCPQGQTCLQLCCHW